MKRTTFWILASLLASAPLATMGGCYASVGVSAYPTRLVEISPGVYVVYDYGQSVFYSGGAYWWWNGGVWYRSPYVNYGWVAVPYGSVPVVVQRIPRPTGYVHYQGRGSVRPIPPGHVRRDDRGAPSRRGGVAPSPPPSDGRGRGSSGSVRPSVDERGRGSGPPPS